MADLKNIRNVCRVCLNTPKHSRLLFLNQTIADKLDFVSGPLEYETSMHLPEYICTECEGELEFVYNFLVKIKLSKLRIKKLHMIAEAKEGDIMYVKSEQSELVSTGELQIVDADVDHETLQEVAQTEVNVDEEKLQLLPVESNCIMEGDADEQKLQLLRVESNCIEDQIKMEMSPIESSYFVEDDKIQTSGFEIKPIVKLSELETSQFETSLDANICHICGKTYSSRANLFRHIREHQGRRFVCTYKDCSSFFTQRSSLKLHFAVHKGEKPFLCYLCSKKFTQQKSLTLHLRIHSGEKPYECDHCKKKFNQRTNLIRHFKSQCKNSKPKKFQCIHCQCFYASKQSLHRHYSVHVRKNEISEPNSSPKSEVQSDTKRFVIKEEISVEIE